MGTGERNGYGAEDWLVSWVRHLDRTGKPCSEFDVRSESSDRVS